MKYQIRTAAPKWDFVRSTGDVLVTHYLRGAVVHHIPILSLAHKKPAPREVIRDMSQKSRQNAAFKFGNAEVQTSAVEWCAMVVLTWHHAPLGKFETVREDGSKISRNYVKETIKKLAREWRKKWGEGIPAWIMEMQARGVPHFHLFVPANSVFGAQCLANVQGGACETVLRKERERVIVRGNLDRWLVNAWLKVTGQDDDADAVAFHRGGIIEMMDSPDAAGRYVAKECSKREQKELPAQYQDGLGRWWCLAKAMKPIPKRRGFASLDAWPFKKPFSRLWKSESLGEASRGSWPMEHDEAAADGIAQWLRDSGQCFSVEDLDAIDNAAIADRNRRDSLCQDVEDNRSEDERNEDYLESVAAMHLARLAGAWKRGLYVIRK